MTKQEALFTYLLRLADDRLILGHRLSEWCGHGPVLEEDIALANMALDNIGHATSLLTYAAEVEDKGRNEDQLAFFRDVREYTNIKLVELPKGDFGFTIARQFLFSTFAMLHYEALKDCADPQLKGMTAKALKEYRYHHRHSKQWIIRLGDGTKESHERIQKSINDLWMYTNELFFMNEVDEVLISEKIAVNLEKLRSDWQKLVEETLKEATLEIPDYKQYMQQGGRNGIHTEHLGYLLGEMQQLPRMYPEAQW